MTTNEWIAIFTLALVFVGVIQAWFLRKALLATQEQGRLTKEAFVADKRAFLSADGFAQFWEFDSATGLYNWRLRPRWRNQGNTPTRHLTFYTSCEIRNSALPDGYVFAHDKAQIGKGFIPPKSELLGGIAPQGPAITAADIAESQGGRRYIYLWGWAKYSDVFPGTSEHVTHFCWLIVVTGDPNTFIPNTPGQPPVVGTLYFNYLQHHEGNYADEG